MLKNNSAQNTGPKALKIELIQFLRAGSDTTNNAHLQPGTYSGGNNHTIMIVVGRWYQGRAKGICFEKLFC
jgi:hypothetical protein